MSTSKHLINIQATCESNELFRSVDHSIIPSVIVTYFLLHDIVKHVGSNAFLEEDQGNHTISEEEKIKVAILSVRRKRSSMRRRE